MGVNPSKVYLLRPPARGTGKSMLLKTTCSSNSIKWNWHLSDIFSSFVRTIYEALLHFLVDWNNYSFGSAGPPVSDGDVLICRYANAVEWYSLLTFSNIHLHVLFISEKGKITKCVVSSKQLNTKTLPFWGNLFKCL